ncbi:Homogentisate 1,2-dioxygenase [Pseudocercospora fuligena]|uniref:homogentisate 1,2-dioxygenase n=1 Tax=Pseudocercospora fuligena TaxID=685502 RepID=A0A8H6VKE5_9PEZI|nr:Homogentisate 1,2-dioxygenase [Pseudocercospora fuligena]
MPRTNFEIPDNLQYLKGLNSYHETEVTPGIIPSASTYEQNSQFGIYPERLSGSSFILQRSQQKQAFLYRLLPSTLHGKYRKVPNHALDKPGYDSGPVASAWAPLPMAEVESNDLLTGMKHIGGAGDPTLKNGVAIYAFTAGKSMPQNQAFDNADGDWCIVPQHGTLDFRTEFGCLRVRPGELCVIPRGIRFHVALPQGAIRGFVFETYSGHYELPELGPIGSYCLANARDFEIPTASIVESDDATQILTKFGGRVYETEYKGSIFNVAAWHGTYYPFKYDLARFAPIGSLLVDHPDPSTFTVLTCAGNLPGQAAADICVLGPRWIVMENSFRPPRYHRNIMTEFAFLLKGSFDATPMPAELAGFFMLQNPMTAHGPTSKSFQRAIAQEMVPERVSDESMGVLFETA